VFAPYVQVIGCSNSSLIVQSYDYYSARHAAISSAQHGLTLQMWASELTNAWPLFDSNFAAYAATAIWYPLCIKQHVYTDNNAAHKDFKTFLGLLRQRTQAPLYVSDQVGAQPVGCYADQDKQTYVVQHAIADGLALQGAAIPPASAPDPTNPCHFDPIASRNVADAAIAFLDT
jgi:hypothetical protein